MRDDYDQFTKRGAEIIGVAPHGPDEVRSLVESIRVPFPVLADENREVFAQYEVESRPWSLGQRPGVYVVDASGMIRWAHVGWQQWDIPTNREVLAILDNLEPTQKVSDGR